jgi:hypothetical protein
MKNLVFISLLFIANLTFAQTNPATNFVPALDTLTNAVATPLTKFLAAPYSTVTVAVSVTKISGTVAGTVTLTGSIDGVTYYAISGASALTLTDVASQGTLWVLTGNPYSYYKVLGTGSGTMSASISAKVLPRKNF